LNLAADTFLGGVEQRFEPRACLQHQLPRRIFASSSSVILAARRALPAPAKIVAGAGVGGFWPALPPPPSNQGICEISCGCAGPVHYGKQGNAFCLSQYFSDILFSVKTKYITVAFIFFYARRAKDEVAAQQVQAAQHVVGRRDLKDL